MIGLTNVICKHCALTCYWQTLNHWPRCQFFMNAIKMLCEFRFFDANAFYKNADAKCPYDAHVSFQRCNFHDADVLCRGADAKFIHDGMSPCGYVMMQMPPCGCAMMRMFWCKHNLFKNSLYFQNEAFSAPETKIFSKLNLLFLKRSSLSFDLRPLKIGDHY